MTHSVQLRSVWIPGLEPSSRGCWCRSIRIDTSGCGGWPLGCGEKLFAMDRLPQEPKAVLEQRQKTELQGLWQSLTHSILPPHVFSGGTKENNKITTFGFSSCTPAKVSVKKKFRAFHNKKKKKNPPASTRKELLRYRHWDIQIYWILSL